MQEWCKFPATITFKPSQLTGEILAPKKNNLQEEE